ncbi:VCBS domain-containing protein [Methylobacterium sp. WL103]|uniref:VCBS domain-containing protein n=1 Tax=Methylobacterium sp. WL103 TaxID=2603891 RepID=UPI00164FE7D3|nr:VCBS domain-containing protein [Methylobacterium sp. WL103]
MTNSAPYVLQEIGVQSVNIRDPFYSYDASKNFADSDIINGDRLIYSLASPANYITIDPHTGVITGFKNIQENATSNIKTALEIFNPDVCNGSAACITFYEQERANAIAGELDRVTSLQIVATDASGATATSTVTFNLVDLPVNAAPVLDVAHSIVTGTITERASLTGSSALDIATGSIAFADMNSSDRPAASVTAQTLVYTNTSGSVEALTVAQSAMIKAGFILNGTASSNVGSADWRYSLADNNFDFLGAGERLTLTSAVQIDDHHGGFVNQVVSVIINGTNDTPTTQNDLTSVGLLGTTRVDASHGVISNDRDPDLHDRITVNSVAFEGNTVSVTAGRGATINGDYGTLIINSDGSYSYTSTLKGSLYHLLHADLIPQDTFAYTASDGHGGVATSYLTATVALQGLQNYVQGTDGNDLLSYTSSKTALGKVLGINDAMILAGGNGDDILKGGNSNDVLIAGSGSDTLTGGTGRDTFVFNEGSGRSTVTDFRAGYDEIQFDHEVFKNFSDVRGHAVQIGLDVVITADVDHTVTLQNVLLKNLNPGDFHFA